MTDLYTDELFHCRHESVIFPISRLICDVERFRHDENEPMSEKGMGAVYTRTHDGRPLRTVRETEREIILQRWYDPHHAKLEFQVSRRLEAFGKCVIIDCHSFSSTPLPHEPDQTPDRPDICIGTDEFHTPEDLSRTALKAIGSFNYSVKQNSPFSGSVVPLRYYYCDSRVVSVMLEVNRALYLDGTSKKSGFEELRRNIASVIDTISNAERQ